MNFALLNGGKMGQEMAHIGHLKGFREASAENLGLAQDVSPLACPCVKNAFKAIQIIKRFHTQKFNPL